MKQHISFVLLLAFVLCLSGCAGRFDLPTDLPTSATEDTPQAAESEKSTKMTTKETTMPEIDTTEPMPVFHRGVRIRWKREDGLPGYDPESTRNAEKLVQGVFELKNAQHA